VNIINLMSESTTANSTARVRKCISAMREVRIIEQPPALPIFVVSPTGERMAFFYCLKMLGILPPPPLSDFK
jgi:hypothetical protein